MISLYCRFFGHSWHFPPNFWAPICCKRCGYQPGAPPTGAAEEETP